VGPYQLWARSIPDILGVALVAPLTSRFYSVGGLVWALIYVFAGTGLFHSLGITFSAAWALRGMAPSRSTAILAFATLNAIGAVWMREITRAHHLGPFFKPEVELAALRLRFA